LTQWQQIEEKLAVVDLDPHRLACGCAVKIDLRRVVYPALRAARVDLERLGVRLNPREDADILPRSEGFTFERHVFPFEASAVRPLPPGDHRAVTVTSAYRVGDPQVLADRWRGTYASLLKNGATLHVGKGHTIEAYSPDDEFVHFDVYKPQGKARPGWQVVNNDTNQLIDPTRELERPEQTEVALSNALNDLFSLGAVEQIKVFPFYAAPSEGLAKRIAENIAAYCQKHGFELVEQPPISGSTLLIGATVFGTSSRQLPTFYEQLEEGDLILVHRAFGDLAPINVLIESMVMNGAPLEGLDLDQAEIGRRVDERIDIMRRPNVEVGHLIQQLSPATDETFDPKRHLKATGDLSGPGIDVFRELAELCGRDVTLSKIPLAEEQLVRYASANYLLPNGTSGTHGALMMVPAPEVIERAKTALEGLGHAPHVIGRIGKAGGTFSVPPQAKAYLSDWPDAYQIRDV